MSPSQINCYLRCKKCEDQRASCGSGRSSQNDRYDAGQEQAQTANAHGLCEQFLRPATRPLAFPELVWHISAVPIWLERYLLPVCAAASIGIIVLNPMNFDWTQRITLGVAIVAVSYFAAHTLHKQRSVQLPQQPPANRASPPAQQAPAENAPAKPAREKSGQKRPSRRTTESGREIEPQQKPIEKITFVEERIASPRPDLPHGLSVTLQTNVAISPVHLRLECSGPIGEARVSFAGPVSAMMGVVTTIDGNRFEFSIQNPPFTPRTPLVVTLFSAMPISTVKVVHIY